ncbi:vp1054 [Lambdina fiscellaria nucleopolyhedrovirus]|uniref:Vp1054 n=1 Tax=Lambdina fiscellaria nucleopolyhedrovirus TaxID=1642929 RepID=A0A0E3Z8B3_9ABAC|nr:vp1054 [Lambdina fiscellaria nucleopolyhedrovirus]AKC91717.1 vp1054 [Lambdina fiscellaria nucleopolyhedrovirus]
MSSMAPTARARTATPVIKYNQCVSEKLVPFRPIKRQKISQCPLHPLRANCKVIKTPLNEDADVENATNRRRRRQAVVVSHETVLETIYLNYDVAPYYMLLVDEAEPRGFRIDAEEMQAYVQLEKLDDSEIFYGLDESGERQLCIITNVIKTLMDALSRVSAYFVLVVDEPIIDVVYSLFRAVVLPQRLVCIVHADHEPVHSSFRVFSVPNTQEALVSQDIYRLFLIYNTVLTMVLKQRNPFNNSSKNISVVLRNLGKCPENSSRVKCCDLRYGGNAPGHVMCVPREMIKRVFHYAKWARAPNNYKRYYELIVQSPRATSTSSRRRMTNNIRNGVDNRSNNPADKMLIYIDWYNFFSNFREYFGVCDNDS